MLCGGMKTKITESVSQPELAWQCSRSKIGWRCDDINLKKGEYTVENGFFAVVRCVCGLIKGGCRVIGLGKKGKGRLAWIHNGG